MAAGLFVILALIYAPAAVDPYFEPKWIALYAGAGAACWFALRTFSVRALARRPSRWMLALLAAALGCAIIHFNVYDYRGVFDFVAFGIFAAMAATESSSAEHFIARLDRANISAVLGVMLVAVVDALRGFDDLSSTFGNVNMAAEFVALSLGLQMMRLPNLLTSWRVGAFRYAIFAASVTYLVLLHSRAGMCMFLGMAFVRWRSEANPRRRRLGVALLSVAAIFWLSALTQAKPESTSIRGIRILNTLQMIRENPWGAGPGNFEFAYPAYRARHGVDVESTEDNVVRSPHNAYLELFAEWGWLVGALAVVVMLQMGRNVARVSELVHLWLQTVGAGLAMAALLGFPLEEPFPFFLFAVWVGVYLRRDGELAKVTARTQLARAFRIATGLLLMGFAVIQALSISPATSAAWTEQILKWNPADWRLRLDVVEATAEQKTLGEASRIVEEGLRHTPQNYLLRRRAITAALDLDQLERACHHYAIYAQTWPGPSALATFMRERCHNERRQRSTPQ